MKSNMKCKRSRHVKTDWEFSKYAKIMLQVDKIMLGASYR